jgi:hypothetical protein
MTEAGWYDSPDGAGVRWWSGYEWAQESCPDHAIRVRRSRLALFVVAGILCVFGTLEAGGQAFGAFMANFDEHVVNLKAVLFGLIGFAVFAWVLFLAAVVVHFVPRTHTRWYSPTYLLLAVVGIEIASLAGLTGQVGLALFS